MLKDARILVIANARGSASGPMQDRGKPAFTVEENDAVQAWVRGGDALLLIAGHWPIVSAMGDLSLKFDVMMGKGFTHDPRDPVRFGDRLKSAIQIAGLPQHVRQKA